MPWWVVNGFLSDWLFSYLGCKKSEFRRGSMMASHQWMCLPQTSGGMLFWKRVFADVSKSRWLPDEIILDYLSVPEILRQVFIWENGKGGRREGQAKTVRGLSSVAPNQGIPGAARSRKRPRGILPYTLEWEFSPANTLDFRLLASRTMREWVAVGFKPPNLG